MTIPIEKTYTVHLPLDRSNGKPPVMTIVIAKRDDPTNVALYYTMGYSLCNPKDQFNKKIGRRIAYGRMIKNPYGYYVTNSWLLGYFLSSKNKTIRSVKDDIIHVFNTLEDRMKNK